MRTPCEWSLNDFVPKIRRELVRKMYDKGYNQKEIAKILAISQPRVSQYLVGEKKENRKMNSNQSQLVDQQLNEIVFRTVNDIMIAFQEGKKPAETIPIICYSCRELRMGNALCSLHRFDYQEIDQVVNSEKNCDLCLKWKTAPKESNESFESLDARFNVLRILESVANMLIMQPTFVENIPQIGAQLCLMYDEQTNNNDLRNVAAFPGRIIQVQGRAKIISRPEFNSSRTTGSLLINIRNSNRKIKSIISIKNQNDPEFEKKIVLLGYLIIKTQAIDQYGLTTDLIKVDYSSATKIAIIDAGSHGYEPIIYLLEENILNLVSLFE